MLTLHLEAETLIELQLAACRALDLDMTLTAVPETKSKDVSDTPSAPPVEPVKGTEEAKTEPSVPAKEAKPRASRAKKESAPLVEIADSIGKPAEEPVVLTLDAVRAAFDQYVQRFGVQAAQIDGPILLSRVFGNGIQRIKDVPEDDQGKLGRIIAAVDAAILTNEFKRPQVQ